MTTVATMPSSERYLVRRPLPLHFLRQFTPTEGWLTMAAVLAPLFIIAWTISEAAWAVTPSLVFVLFVAAVMGLGVSKAPGMQGRVACRRSVGGRRLRLLATFHHY